MIKRLTMLAALLSIAAAAGMLGAGMSRAARADNYDNEWMECHYITQCSMSSANATVSTSIAPTSSGYGALNNWRIGNGKADSVDCGTSAIGAIGLLYGYHRLVAAGRSNSDLDPKATTALKTYFWRWVTNSSNHIAQNSGGVNRDGFPTTVSYTASGAAGAKGAGSAATTAQILIAMRKYCELSPNGDGAPYQTQEFALAHRMANYIDANLSGWTSDRSYAVAALRCFAGWAAAMGAKSDAADADAQADAIAKELLTARDTGAWFNYYDYMNGSTGVYNNNNVDQVGFSPYEFDALPATDGYAPKVAVWWDTATSYSGDHMTEQSGPYIGGVHQSVPSLATKCYPGDSFQLADAEWKIAHADGNASNQYAQAWAHYNFALSPQGAAKGSGCWVNDTATDGYIGGFVDWVDDTDNSRPVTWQRFVDTSGYMIVATEELAFSSIVDWSS